MTKYTIERNIYPPGDIQGMKTTRAIEAESPKFRVQICEQGIWSYAGQSYDKWDTVEEARKIADSLSQRYETRIVRISMEVVE